jgi:hypothetical protein
MKTQLTASKKVLLLGALLLMAFGYITNAQQVEKLIVYENFGGFSAAGSSETGIEPDMWPAVHSDSGEYAGWYTTNQKLDNKNGSFPVPQFYGNKTFHIDSVAKYKDGGIPADITVVDATKRWFKATPFLNSYTTVGDNANLEVRVWGGASMPTFMSWMSYAENAPDYISNQTDEMGYIYLAKDIAEEARPAITLPHDDFDFFQNLTKLKIMFSGSRLGQNNTLSVKIEELDEFGATLGTSFYTYSATIEPRTVEVPVNKDYCRIYIQGWGSANNANVTDFALSNNNTMVDTTYDYNYNAIAGTKPDGSTTNGQTGNPGVSIHMLKMYALMDDAGYSITTDGALVTGTTTGIAHGTTTTLTAAATDGDGDNFMGWNITGEDNLSEVVNPLTITVTEDMTIMPVYAGDEVLLPVVNENFTDWKQEGTVLIDKNNRLDYDQGDPYRMDPATVVSGTVKVPFRYGYTSGGEDSLEITMKACNVMPGYGLRAHNLPGWEEMIGFVAFMGPNADKGYVSLDTLTNISKAVVTVSSYDQTNPDRFCAIYVNDSIMRNKSLHTLYAEDITITNDPADDFQLQVGPGNQARFEYLTPIAANADIETGLSAAAVAMHNLKLYATVTVPDKAYYQLVLNESDGGYITGASPVATNSTSHYLEGEVITIGATPDFGKGFLGWHNASDALVSLENPYTFTITEDMELTPKFGAVPSYVKVIENEKGTITSNPEPENINGEVREFIAGVAVTLTAEPVFGYEFTKFIKNGSDVESNPITLTNLEMGIDDTTTLEVVYDSIIATNQLAIAHNAVYGELVFDPEPVEAGVTVGDTLFIDYPVGTTVNITAYPNYSYQFDGWADGSTDNPLKVTVDTDVKLGTTWSELPRYYLDINQGPNGTVKVTDEHKSGTEESQNRWPKDYKVRLTAEPNIGYALTSVGEGVSSVFEDDTIFYVKMTDDTVSIYPEFSVRAAGVILAIDENFQDATMWPENPGTVSNVPGAISFLELSDDWDPTTYNDDLEGLLTLLSSYRDWGSQSNDNSEGPNGTKTPMTTLNLEFESTPLTVDLQIGTTNDYATMTLANYAPCNNCLIGKAVKSGFVSYHYLGHVTPGMIALRGVSADERLNEDFPPFLGGDSVGTMLIEGLAYVEKLEIGYVSSGSQHCPGVFYAIDENLQVLNSNGIFEDVYGEIYSIGRVDRPDYTPYDNKYGWGSAQEGMIMDKNMYIGEEDLTDTKVIITSGYKTAGEGYDYTNIYIHDLKIWGSADYSNDIKEVISNHDNKKSAFYMLGNSNVLKVDITEPAKAIVIYNMNGSAIKVIRDLNTNEIELNDLEPGIYGAHVYGVSGKQYVGSFGKVNY